MPVKQLDNPYSGEEKTLHRSKKRSKYN